MNSKEMINRLASRTNNHSEQSGINVGQTLESDLKKVVDNFHDMNLKEELLNGIYRHDFERPTPLQQRAILPCIMGHDVIIQSPPGTGKTTSVLISILQQIDTSFNECQALILAPSRKLALQIQKVVIAFGDFLKADHIACIGRKSICICMNKLDTVPHVMVGTPDCVSNLINKHFLRTQFIKIFVLEKANALLNYNEVQIKKVLDFLREDTQVILLSTNMSKKALDKSTHFVSNPVHIFMKQEELTLETIKKVIINKTQENDTKKKYPSESKDYSGSLSIDVGGTIESDWNEEVDNFHEINLKEELLCSIYKCGFRKPLAIQQHSILPCLKGQDVIVQAESGTGKTTSVLISILQRIDTSLNECQALILVPMRELALQIQKMVIELCEFVKAYACIGGSHIRNDMRELLLGSHVIVGTPGRVNDLIARNSLQTKFTKIFVLDNFKLLSNGSFNDQIKEVFKSLKEDTQVILLSNEMSKSSLYGITHFLRNPLSIFMQKEKKTLKALKPFYINNTKKNDMKNGQPSETNDHSELSGMYVGKTIEADLMEVVDNFHEMNLKEELLRGIYEYGFEKPLDIQRRAVLQCIKGHDITVQAQSFSGKTTSVLISILQQIDTNLNETQALILAPSFEAVRQIQNVVIALSKFMKANCYACTGKDEKNISDYMRELDTFPHVVLGTTACVFDLIVGKFLRTKFIKIFVLEEANILLFKNNINLIKEVFKYLEEDTQIILLSNRMSKKALEESTHFVSNPVRIFMHKEEFTLEAFKQSYIKISKKNYTGPLSIDVGRKIESDWKEMVENFHDMNLKEELLRGIYKYGFEKPLAIQQHSILPCLKGQDVIVQAESGTGKTTSVLISILHLIDISLNECQALILTPSYDTALQIQKDIIAFGVFMKAVCHTCIGGNEIPYNVHELDTFPHVLVGTPSCVFDTIARKSLQTQFIKIFVLEETNFLLSQGNKDIINEVFKFLEVDTQVILLSYRMSKKALDESTNFVTNPVCIFMHKEESTLEGIKHFFVNFSNEECKFDSLCNLFETLSITQVVIFCDTRHKVEWLTECMRLKTFNVLAMHEEIDRRQRYKILFQFRSGSIPVLITTHMFAKTIDIQQVSLVISYDLPSNSENFVYRIERSRYVARKGIILHFNTEDKNLEIKKPTNSYLVRWPITDYTNQSTPCSLPSASIPKDSTVHISVTKNSSGPLVTDETKTIEYDWKEVVINFHDMNLKEELLRGIFKYGFEKPLAIQQRAIFPCIKGHDVIIQANAGTGKTTSVLISILQQIDTSFNECQALILTPSRKLALQIQKVVIAFGDFMKADCYASIHGINSFGKMPKLNTIPHLVVGTPACVSDLIARKFLGTKFIKIFVLDETNKLLNRGIKDQINEVFKVLEKDIQVILLSNPMPKDVLNVSTHFLQNPVCILMQ